MSVFSVDELFPGRQGNDDFTRHRTYTRVFEVYCTSDDDGPATAGGSVLLPRLGDAHPEDSQAVVVSVNPVQDAEEPLRWEVSINYDTQPELPDALQPGEDIEGGGGGVDPGTELPIADKPDNPLDRPPVWKFSSAQTTEVAKTGFVVDDETGDITGVLPEAIATSAGMPFDPPVTIEVSRPVVSVTVNLPSISVFLLSDVQDSVNEFEWKGCEPRTVRCIGAEANSAFENNVYFWSVTYTFAVKWDTWDVRVLDAGYHQKVRDSWLDEDTIVAIVDNTGQNGGPWLLDGFGGKLAAGGTPIYKRYHVAKLRNFGAVLPI